MDDHETIEKDGKGFVKGSEYDRLLKEFIEKGGDASECPFETKEKHPGPNGSERWKERQ